MGQLENMQLFIKVVELGSITKTADQLNIAKSAVSRRLNELEHSLGVTLLQRTTRKSHLTEAGQLYYNRSKQLVSEFEQLNNQLTQQKQNLTGTLKVAVPLTFGVMHLMPAIELFIREHPALKLDIHFSDRKVDIIEEGFDLAFRIGELQDSSFKARKLMTIKHILCASPDYLSQYGSPRSIEQLQQHKLLKYSDIANAGFSIVSPDGTKQIVNMEARYNANNGDFLKYMALTGHGVTLIPDFIIWQELTSGQLISLLNDHQFGTLQAYALFPNSQFLPNKVRMLIDFLVDKFSTPVNWQNKG